jgi:hypothetical protein
MSSSVWTKRSKPTSNAARKARLRASLASMAMTAMIASPTHRLRS